MELWASNILMALLSFLNVSDVSLVPADNWTVDSHWAKQLDDSYKLEISSSTIPKQCAEEAYLVVHVPYMGLVEVFAGDTIVFTNSPGKRWNLSSSLYRYTVSCKYFLNSDRISVHISSPIRFFATLNAYPYISSTYPLSQFFYEEFYILTAILVFQLGLVGALFAFKLLSSGTASLFFMYNFAFAMSMYGHSPGVLSNINVALAQAIVLVSLCGALVYFSAFSMGVRRVKRLHAVFFVLSAATLIGIYDKINVTQLLIECFLPVAITGTFLLFVYKLKTRDKFTAFLYFLVWAFTVKDCYMAQVARDGFLYLSLLTAVVAIVGIAELVRSINIASKNLADAELSLLSERQLLDKVSKFNDLSREIIHDVKSPLTAIEFGLTGGQSGSLVSEATKRVKEILSRVDAEEFKKHADWYSVAALEGCIDRIVVEKNVQNIKVEMSEGLEESLVFFDRVELSVVIAEIFDNAQKYGVRDDLIELKIYVIPSYVVLEIKNKFVADDSVYSRLGYGSRGNSKEGSGLGLSNLTKKIQSMGGQVKLEAINSQFIVQIQLRSRNIT